MYINPNTGSLLLQVFAAILAGITGIAFLHSRQTRLRAVRIRRLIRKPQSDWASTIDEKTGDMR